MIDLTPLDVRKKRGDFRRILRGYDPEEVDAFLELVAERLEALVKENLSLGERVARLDERVRAQEGKENAVQEALVTAQALREEIRNQAAREAELLKREAEATIRERIQEVEEGLRERHRMLEELERQRQKFLRSFRTFLERELDMIEVEESRRPLEDVTLDLDLLKEIRERAAERVEEGVPGAPEEAGPEEVEGPEPGAVAGAAAAGDPVDGLPAGEGEGGSVEAVLGEPAPAEADSVEEGSPDEPLWLSSLLDTGGEDGEGPEEPGGEDERERE